jgi:hypothetical protein
LVEANDGSLGMYSSNHPFYVKDKETGVIGWCRASDLVRKKHSVVTTEKMPVLDEYSSMTVDEAFALGVLFRGIATPLHFLPLVLKTEPLICKVQTRASDVSYSHDIVNIVRELAESKGWSVSYYEPAQREFSNTRTVYVAIRGAEAWMEQHGYWVERTNRIQRLHSSNTAFFHKGVMTSRSEVATAFLAGFLIMKEGFLISNSLLIGLPTIPVQLFHPFYWLCRVANKKFKLNHRWFRRTEEGKKGKNNRSSIMVMTHAKTVVELFKTTYLFTMNPSAKRVLKYYDWLMGKLPGYEVGIDDPNPVPERTDILEKSTAVSWRWSPVISCLAVGNYDTYAVTIKSEEHTHLTDGMLTHNTQQISIGRSLWEIGKNPNIRICIIQATEGLAEDIVSTIKRYIEHSPEYKRIFPHVRRGVEWTTTSLSVERSPTIKDPTVLAAGVHGNILGRRFDLIIGDDFLTSENTATEYMRDDVFNWMLTTPMSRITRNGRIWLIGNAWSREDALHRFAKMQGWNHYVFPVRDPITKNSYWPERWPNDRIADFEMRRTPWEVARALDCKARSDEAGRFREAWFTAALERGHGLFGDDTMCWALGAMPPGCQTFTGVDLGISEAAGSDVTAITTLMVKPDNRITMLNVESGNWDANEIIERIIRAHHRFKSMVFVESLFAQRWILQLIRKKAPNLPVFPFQTRGTGTVRNKRHTFFGVEAVAAELAQGLWDIPRSKAGQIDPEIQNFIQGCLMYSSDEHTSDQLMSAWIALQGARKQTGIIGVSAMAESGMYTIETEPLSYEEKAERTQLSRALEKQKSAESWWEDVRGDLDLPEMSSDELAKQLGINDD